MGYKKGPLGGPERKQKHICTILSDDCQSSLWGPWETYLEYLKSAYDFPVFSYHLPLLTLTDFIKALKGLVKALKSLNKALKGLIHARQCLNKALKGLNRALQGLINALKGLNKTLRRLIEVLKSFLLRLSELYYGL
jgi:hypothetical protein